MFIRKKTLMELETWVATLAQGGLLQSKAIQNLKESIDILQNLIKNQHARIQKLESELKGVDSGKED